MSDHTQPGPGPTREQIKEAIRSACPFTGLNDATDAVMALLPERPTEAGEVRVNACQTNPQTPEDVAAIDSLVAAVVDLDRANRPTDDDLNELRAYAETKGTPGYAPCSALGRDTALRLLAEVERLREMAGQHDPTGQDHMEQMWEHAQRADAAEAEVERLRAQQGPVSDDVIRDLVAAAAGLSEGANPTAAGRFADALRRELAARGLEITSAHPSGGTA